MTVVEPHTLYEVETIRQVGEQPIFGEKFTKIGLDYTGKFSQISRGHGRKNFAGIVVELSPIVSDSGELVSRGYDAEGDRLRMPASKFSHGEIIPAIRAEIEFICYDYDAILLLPYTRKPEILFVCEELVAWQCPVAVRQNFWAGFDVYRKKNYQV